MQKNLYYRTVFKRTNTIKETMLGFFMAFSSYPRLLLEVFIRRNFGERYFSFSGSVFLTVLLSLYPLMKVGGLSLFRAAYGYYGSVSFGSFMGHYATWYGFVVAFMVMADRRNEEIKRLPSVYDFARFSLSGGQFHPRFLQFEIGNRRFSTRTIETLIEPAFFFLIGVVVWLLGQGIGLVFILCSIFYSFSYQAAYYQGDQFVMDKIDEMICNEELVKSFVEGRDPSETRGFNFQGRRPTDPETRRRVVETFTENEDMVVAL